MLVGAFALLVIGKLVSEAGELGSLDWGRFGFACAIACVLSIGNYLLRYLRWQMFLAQLGAQAPAWTSLLCYMAGFAFTLLPGKAGELMRVRYYARLGVPASCVGAGFIMERLLDVTAICLLCLLGLGALMSLAGVGSLVLAVAVVLSLMAALLPWGLRRLDVRFPLQAKADETPPERQSGIRAFVHDAYHHGRSLLRPRVVGPGLALGVIAWALEGLGFWLLVGASGFDAYSAGQAISAYSISLLAGAVSFMPGGLGSTEAVMLLSLDHAGATAQAALVITLLCRLATLWLAVVLGWMAVATLAIQHNRKADAK